MGDNSDNIDSNSNDNDDEQRVSSTNNVISTTDNVAEESSPTATTVTHQLPGMMGLIETLQSQLTRLLEVVDNNEEERKRLQHELQQKDLALREFASKTEEEEGR